jgi:hypothetical protein
MLRLASILVAMAWSSTPGCTDDGVIGSNGDGSVAMDAGQAPACVPACEPDEVCDLSSGRCLECTSATDCEAPDECDDCGASDVACIAMFCTSCTTDADCSDDEPLCMDGRCAEIDL